MDPRPHRVGVRGDAGRGSAPRSPTVASHSTDRPTASFAYDLLRVDCLLDLARAHQPGEMLEAAVVGPLGRSGEAAGRQLAAPQVVLDAFAADTLARARAVAAVASAQVLVLLAVHGVTLSGPWPQRKTCRGSGRRTPDPGQHRHQVQHAPAEQRDGEPKVDRDHHRQHRAEDGGRPVEAPGPGHDLLVSGGDQPDPGGQHHPHQQPGWHDDGHRDQHPRDKTPADGRVHQRPEQEGVGQHQRRHAATGQAHLPHQPSAILHPAAEQAPQAAGDQQREQHHPQRVDRVAQVQREAMQQRDLDQDEPDPDADEVQQVAQLRPRAASEGGALANPQRDHDAGQHQQRHQPQQRDEDHRPGGVELDGPRLEQAGDHVLRLHGIEEERPLVIHRPQIHRERVVERLHVPVPQHDGARVAGVAAHRRVEHAVLAPARLLVQRVQFLVRERGALDQDRGQRQLARGEHVALRVFDAEPRKRGPGQGAEPHELHAPHPGPAAHGDDPPGRQVLQVVLERLHRVQVVLGQRERPGGRGGPGVHQRGLDHVELPCAASDEVTPLGQVGLDVGLAVEVPAVLAVAAPHHVVEDDRVDLGQRDVPVPVLDRAEHVDPAAGTDDQHAPSGADDVDQRGDALVGVEPLDVLQRVDVGAGQGVDGEDRWMLWALRQPLDLDAREGVPLHELEPVVVHILHVPHPGERVELVHTEQQQQPGQQPDRYPLGLEPSHVGAEDHRRRCRQRRHQQHRALPAHQPQQRVQQQAGQAGPHQIEEVERGHPLAQVVQRERHHHPAVVERNRRGAVQERELPEALPAEVPHLQHVGVGPHGLVHDIQQRQHDGHGEASAVT